MPPSTFKTNIATSTPTSITVRGRDLVHDLMGQHTFTAMLYFLTTGKMPTPGQTRVLDACLVTLMEHGLTPAALLARIMANSVPGQVQVAIAAGLLSVGEVNAGTMEGCAALLAEGIAFDGDIDKWCRDTVARFRSTRASIPGFGHAFHKPDDPRTPRLLEIAREAGVKGNYIALLLRIGAEVDRSYGKHLTINATGAIGAALLEIGLPVSILRGIAVVSRAGGLCGHLLEEEKTKSMRGVHRWMGERMPYEDPKD